MAGATGSVTTSVTGDIGAFIQNRTVANGIAEVAAWLDERQAQSFDVVYVPPDHPLVVHVTRELQIDRDPQGRKVNHELEFETDSRRRLD